MRFIPAGQLKDKFAVFGHFYSVQVAPRKWIECRSVLEIMEAEHAPAKALSDRRPDAIFIMMNPGSSRPLTDVNNRIRAEAIHQFQMSLVPTKPDTTQYQVMRLMHFCRWRHVRVLNLSDSTRRAKSGEFFKLFTSLEADHLFDGHSIFSHRRVEELASKLTRHTDVPVILAWGVSFAF